MTDSPTTDQTLTCGCVLKTETTTEDDSTALMWLVPCTEQHRTIAMMRRKPGSMLVVCQVPA
jgi:hypothetical protein